MIKLYNTLSRKKENFKPIKPKQVSIYSCGPTVYWYAHVGNLRTYLFSDILKRVFLYNKFNVKHVMNITDVDDKTIKGSQREKTSLKKFTDKYEKIFFEDMKELNTIEPLILKATDSIKEMVSIIKKLLQKGYAYKASDGIYFSISKFKNYGKLANLKNLKNSKERILNDEYGKENPQDFALWKFYSKDDGDVFWDTELGKGRPGWHIECSAMSMKLLGKHFDIHTGGSDLIFPHHTNEIAQSEASTGTKFVNYWLHGGFLNVENDKMSKSLGNILTLKELKEKGFSPLDYRYFCLTGHYRKPLNVSTKNLEAAKNSLQRLKNLISKLKDDKKTNKKYLLEFEKAINDDLNMPVALQILWNLVRDEKASGKIQTIKKMDEVFGLNLFEKEKISIPKEVLDIVKEREKARKNKDWKKADELREKINTLGYSLEDTTSGPIIKK